MKHHFMPYVPGTIPKFKNRSSVERNAVPLKAVLEIKKGLFCLWKKEKRNRHCVQFLMEVIMPGDFPIRNTSALL